MLVLFVLIPLSEPIYEHRLYVSNPIFEAVWLCVCLRFLFCFRAKTFPILGIDQLLLFFYLVVFLSAVLQLYQDWDSFYYRWKIPDLHFNKGIPVYGETFRPSLQALRPLLTLTEGIIAFFYLRFSGIELRAEKLLLPLGVVLGVCLFGIINFALVDNSTVFFGYRRAVSVFSGPNVYGGYLVLVGPFVLWLAMRAKAGWRRWLAWVAVTSFIVSLALSRSYGALCGTIAALLYAGFLVYGSQTRARIGILLGLSAVLVFSGLALVLREESIARNAMLHGRWFLWKAGWLMALDHPFTGIGLGGYAQHLAEYYLQFTLEIERRTHAHNMYLQIAGESGFFALFSILMFFAAILRTLFERQEEVARVLSCAILGVLVHSFFDYTNLVCSLSFLFFTYLGLAVSQKRVTE